jgi:phosphoenolpyruvate carboxykinase (ATP)
MVSAAINGVFSHVPLRIDPTFGVTVPEQCPGVPAEVLDPRLTWDKAGLGTEAYDQQAQLLAGKFAENFAQFAGNVPEEVMAAGPQGDRV